MKETPQLWAFEKSSSWRIPHGWEVIYGGYLMSVGPIPIYHFNTASFFPSFLPFELH